jgi:hypothetical protein
MQVLCVVSISNRSTSHIHGNPQITCIPEDMGHLEDELDVTTVMKESLGHLDTP